MFLVSICTLPVTVPVPLPVVSDQTAGQHQHGWRTQHSVLRPRHRCVCAFFGPIGILVPTCTVPVTVPVVSDQTEGQHQRGWRTQRNVLRPQRRCVCTFLVSCCSYLYCTWDCTCGFRPNNKAASASMEDPS